MPRSVMCHGATVDSYVGSFVRERVPSVEVTLKPGFMYMWEYFIVSEHTRPFLDAYSASGEWAQLFRHAPGYIRTELHQDDAQPQRYVTIDYWESEAAWDAFRSAFSREFEELDARGEEWTMTENEIGRFRPVG